MKKILAYVLVICIMFSVMPVIEAEAHSENGKNVIYIIAEGMGANLIQYTQWKYKSAYEELNMQSMAVTGLVATYSADNGVSDDAAAGTHLATGSLTDNGGFGVGAELDGYRVYENIFEAAQRNGKMTGIISDTAFTEGVAASFLAHGKSVEEIDGQIDGADVDVKIENSTSLLNDMKAALNSFKGSEGFVLVIDCTSIEGCVEENDAVGAMEAVYLLDNVVGEALRFAQNDPQTLVVVTSEQEAGAVSTKDLTSRSEGSDEITFNSTLPSQTNVMLFAQGCGQEHFNGYYHSSSIARKIAHITGIEGWNFYDAVTHFEGDDEEKQETEHTVFFECDFEGSIKNAALVGNAKMVTDADTGSRVLKLDNTASSGSYLALTRGLFNNAQTLVIEMDVKSSQKYDKNSSLFQMANKAEPSRYFYFKYEPLGQGIRYSLNSGSDWKSSGNEEITGIDGDEFVHLKYVIEPTRHIVYIDGEEFLVYDTKGSIPMLGNDLYAYIGHSMFSGDKDYTGVIDNVKISGERLIEVDKEVQRVKKSVTVTKAEAETDADLPQSGEGYAKNVIILIGDGMGQNITQLSQWYYNGAREPFAMQRMPYIGLSKTYSLSSGVTDSAAGGTALATGKKAKNSFVASAYALEKYKTIIDYAIDNGKGTAVITTTDITDATPAAYSSHAMDRAERELIAQGQADSGIDIFMGSGRERFVNISEQMEAEGYKYITTKEEMTKLEANDKVLGLFAESGDLLQPLEGKDGEPLLSEMVEKTIEMLEESNESGFVIMAEGATIDHYAHSNYAPGAMMQTKLFDDAVRAALDFAEKDGNTLVVVTADHETGGLALTGSDETIKKASARDKHIWTTGNHSSAYVPIYAYGPGAEMFTGVHDNTEVFSLTMESVGWEESVRPGADEVRKGLILDLDFDDENAFGDYGAAKIHGKLSYADGYKGKAVCFDGNAENYIELFSDTRESLLFSGEEFTVSFWEKCDSTSATNWFFYAAPGEGTQEYAHEMYIGILDKGTKIEAERYMGSRDEKLSIAVTKDTWKYVTLVVEEGKTSIYVDGVLKLTKTSTAPMGDILELEPICYIGRANWVDGEGAKGLVDEYKIYNYALSRDEITALYNGEKLPGDLRGVLSGEYIDGDVCYSLEMNDEGEARRVYIALYNEEGAMVSVKSYNANIIEDSFENVEDGEYTLSAFVWQDDLLYPVWSNTVKVNK